MVSKVSSEDISSSLFHMCSRCDALPKNLDGPGNHRRTHEKTDILINKFDPGILWDDYGIHHDIVVCSTLLAFDA